MIDVTAADPKELSGLLSASDYEALITAAH